MNSTKNVNNESQDFVLINISLKRNPQGDSLWPDTARIASIYIERRKTL